MLQDPSQTRRGLQTATAVAFVFRRYTDTDCSAHAGLPKELTCGRGAWGILTMSGLGGQFSRLMLALVFRLIRSTILIWLAAAVVVLSTSTSVGGAQSLLGAVGTATADAALPALRPHLAPRPRGRLPRAGAGSFASAVGALSTSMSAGCWASCSQAEAAELLGVWRSAEPPMC